MAAVPARPRTNCWNRLLNRLNGEDAGQYTSQLGDGRIIVVSVRPTPDGGTVTTHQDITERRKAEERIAHMARHDALTGLPNRVLFREKMAEGLVRVESRPAPWRFCASTSTTSRHVNDTLGHPVGDRLLSAVAERLVRCGRRRRHHRAPRRRRVRDPAGRALSRSHPRRSPRRIVEVLDVARDPRRARDQHRRQHRHRDRARTTA